MSGRSTYVRTTATIAPAPVVPRCPDGGPHHWRVDAMWDSPQDAALERVQEHCLHCGATKYVPRYYEGTWSRSTPGGRTIARPLMLQEEEADTSADSFKELW